jgi:HEAT repeat protein
MRKMERWLAVTALVLSFFVLTGFGYKRTEAPSVGNLTGVSRYVALLKTGSAQQKAAAAYWLGRQKATAAEAITSLAAILGDTTEIHPSQYRPAARDQKATLGEEAAVALAQIGRPAIDPLIRVLKTSPSPEARKNAAWALGEIHDTSIAGEAA